MVARHWHLTAGELTTERLGETRYQQFGLVGEDQLKPYAGRFRGPRLDRAIRRWLLLAADAEKGTVPL